jgi:dipeptidyl aminopeptidase/acylaminoacyl peptidase
MNPGADAHDLLVIRLAGGPARVAASGVKGYRFAEALSWSPDGRWLSYFTWNPGEKGVCHLVAGDGAAAARRIELPPVTGGMQQPPQWDAGSQALYGIVADSLWRVRVASGTAEPVTGLPEHRLLEIVAPALDGRFWSPDGGSSLYLQVSDAQDYRMGLARVDLAAGKVTQRLLEDKRYGDAATIDVAADGRQMVYATEDAGHPPDLWSIDGELRSPRRVTRINPELDEYVMGTTRLVGWQTADGLKLRGALLLPAGYQAGKRYPLVLYVYGGASLSREVNHFGLGGIQNLQLLATRGYAVLLPDIPSRGDSELKNIARMAMPGLEQVIAMGIADPERLGVMGHSNGGYTTLCMIVQSTRFKAAVVSAGGGNLFSSYGHMRSDGDGYNTYWIEKGLHAQGGTPWELRAKYIENSPVFHLDQVRTPVLLLHGAEDVSVPSVLADEVFVCLRRLGQKVVYAKYMNEGHVPARWGYPNQLDFTQRMLGWFDEHLKR